MFRILLHTIFIAVFTISTPAYAENLQRDQAIASVIADQLDAFSTDDATRAFSHATPGIKAYFKHPEKFMRMVKTAYDMIYRPSAHELRQVKDIGEKIYQHAVFTDQKNKRFNVFYEMQQQDDSSWKINGVQLFKAKELAV